MLEQFRELIAKRDVEGIRRLASELLPTDLSTLLEELAPAERALAFRSLQKDQAIAVFENLGSEQQQELLRNLHSGEMLQILEEMSPDDRTRLLDEMPAKVTKRILEQLTPQEREISALLLGYPPRTAGRIMTPDYVSLHKDMRVAQALEKIRQVGLQKETIYTCYVTDNERRLEGVVGLRDLVLSDPTRTVEEIMDRRVVAVRTEDDQEVAARLIQEYDLLAVPVLDREGRLVGIVTVDDAVDVLEEEVSEDFQRIMAVAKVSERGWERYFDLGVFSRVLRRLPWLAALLAAEVVSGSIIGFYEHALQAVLVLSVFIPMIMDTTGNVGSQTTTLIVRSMATGELDRSRARRQVAGEVVTLICLGTLLGMVAFAVALAMAGDRRVALTVAVALAGTVNATGLVAMLLPFLFRLIRIDPAVASAPLITTIGDAVGLLLYFNIARYLFGF
ncbi:MAG: magnesium transporter [Moorellales bacterium]